MSRIFDDSFRFVPFKSFSYTMQLSLLYFSISCDANCRNDNKEFDAADRIERMTRTESLHNHVNLEYSQVWKLWRIFDCKILIELDFAKIIKILRIFYFKLWQKYSKLLDLTVIEYQFFPLRGNSQGLTLPRQGEKYTIHSYGAWFLKRNYTL